MDGCCGLRRRLLASRPISRRSRLARLRQEALDPGLFLVPDRRRFNAAPASLIAAGLAALGVSRTDAFETAAVVERYRRPAAGRRSDPPARRAVRGGLKGGPFESAVELSEVVGLEDFSQARLNRYFTVHGRATAGATI